MRLFHQGCRALDLTDLRCSGCECIRSGVALLRRRLAWRCSKSDRYCSSLDLLSRLTLTSIVCAQSYAASVANGAYAGVRDLAVDALKVGMMAAGSATLKAVKIDMSKLKEAESTALKAFKFDFVRIEAEAADVKKVALDAVDSLSKKSVERATIAVKGAAPATLTGFGDIPTPNLSQSASAAVSGAISDVKDMAVAGVVQSAAEYAIEAALGPFVLAGAGFFVLCDSSYRAHMKAVIVHTILDECDRIKDAHFVTLMLAFVHMSIAAYRTVKVQHESAVGSAVPDLTDAYLVSDHTYLFSNCS